MQFVRKSEQNQKHCSLHLSKSFASTIKNKHFPNKSSMQPEFPFSNTKYIARLWHLLYKHFTFQPQGFASIKNFKLYNYVLLIILQHTRVFPTENSANRPKRIFFWQKNIHGFSYTTLMFNAKGVSKIQQSNNMYSLLQTEFKISSIPIHTRSHCYESAVQLVPLQRIPPLK